MSVIEDSRKVLQDFLAPELRAISARLDALEKQLERVDRLADDYAIRERAARLESRESSSHHQ